MKTEIFAYAFRNLKTISGRLWNITNIFASFRGHDCVVIMTISWTRKYSFFGDILRETNLKTEIVANAFGDLKTTFKYTLVYYEYNYILARPLSH